MSADDALDRLFAKEIGLSKERQIIDRADRQELARGFALQMREDLFFLLGWAQDNDKARKVVNHALALLRDLEGCA